jgi:hypothetical protein
LQATEAEAFTGTLSSRIVWSCFFAWPTQCFFTGSAQSLPNEQLVRFFFQLSLKLVPQKIEFNIKCSRNRAAFFWILAYDFLDFNIRIRCDQNDQRRDVRDALGG